MNDSIIEKAEVEAYYDGTARKRLKDYVYGNKRVASATELISSQIGRSTRNMLDLGCGIGISAAELASRHDWMTIHAVDLSPKSIETAVKLFGGDSTNLVFEVGDAEELPRMAPYDVITMLDVYEHIPRVDWPRMNALLAQALADDGTLVLTTPTPLHQEFLARNNPDGLQIIDETVEAEDFITLARDIGGSIMLLKSTSIWRKNDYFHVIIKRNPCYSKIDQPAGNGRAWRGMISPFLEKWSSVRRNCSISGRRKLVHAKLGVYV